MQNKPIGILSALNIKHQYTDIIGVVDHPYEALKMMDEYYGNYKLISHEEIGESVEFQRKIISTGDELIVSLNWYQLNIL